MVTCGEEPGVGLAAKWVSISNGYMWRGTWGGSGCQVGKCQQWLNVEKGLGVSLAQLPSGYVSTLVPCGEESRVGLAAIWVSAMVTCGEEP